MPMHAIRAGLLGAAVLAAFTPLSFQSAGGVASRTAVCPTCCPQPGATCVICGTQQCSKERDYYEGKIGPGACVIES
jgi:hypothetical protein